MRTVLIPDSFNFLKRAEVAVPFCPQSISSPCFWLSQPVFPFSSFSLASSVLPRFHPNFMELTITAAVMLGSDRSIVCPSGNVGTGSGPTDGLEHPKEIIAAKETATIPEKSVFNFAFIKNLIKIRLFVNFFK